MVERFVAHVLAQLVTWSFRRRTSPSRRLSPDTTHFSLRTRRYRCRFQLLQASFEHDVPALCSTHCRCCGQTSSQRRSKKSLFPNFYATTYSKLGSGVSASIYCINRCFWLSPKLRLRLRPALTFILFFCLSCASRRGFSSFPLLAFFTGFANFRVLRSESCFVREMRLTMRRSEPAPLRLSR